MTPVRIHSPYRDSREHRSRLFEDVHFDAFVADFRTTRGRRIRRAQQLLILIAVAPFTLLLTAAALLQLSTL